MVEEILKLFHYIVLLNGAYVLADITIMIGRSGYEMDLSNLTGCDAWKYEGVDLTMPMNVTNSSTGIYKCSTSDEEILLMSIDYLEFGWQPNPLFQKTEMILNCFAMFWPKKYKYKSKITLVDDKGKEIGEQEKNDNPVQDADAEISAEVTATTGTPGDYPHFCKWDITVEHEGKSYSYSVKLDKTIVVYLPVENVKPDKTEVKSGEKIECSAGGHPPPHSYRWECYTSGSAAMSSWLASDATLIFTIPGEYTCTCTAENVVPPSLERATWKGVMKVQPSAEQLTTEPPIEDDPMTEPPDEATEKPDTGGPKKTGKKGGKKGGKAPKQQNTNFKDAKKPVAARAPPSHGGIDPFVHLGPCFVTLLLSAVRRCS